MYAAGIALSVLVAVAMVAGAVATVFILRRSTHPDDSDLLSITCPQCGRTSYHPDDIRQGYCGFCHDWTCGSRHALR